MGVRVRVDRMKVNVDRKARGERGQTDKPSFPSLGSCLLLLIKQKGEIGRKKQIITYFSELRFCILQESQNLLNWSNHSPTVKVKSPVYLKMYS